MFQQGAFIFDGNETPEDIARKRLMMRSMAPQYGRARYVGEGLGHLGMGIAQGIGLGRANRAEKEGKASGQNLMDRILGRTGSSGGGFSILGTQGSNLDMTPSQPAAPSPDANDPRRGAFATGNSGETLAPKDRVIKGLMARGMPQHVAEGFAMNFQDESGLDAGINEISPLVPGSRGGFGLAQWTGPRRKQLEAFAAERGVPVNDENMQMDFLVWELANSEKGAANEIFSTQNSGDAAAAIVNKFLRPAEEHRARREASYLAGSGGNVAAGGPSGPSVSELQGYMMDPAFQWLAPEQQQLVQTMYAQAVQQADPMRQLQMERAQLEIERLRNPPLKAQPADVQKYEYYAAQETAAGRTPLSYGDWSIMDERASVGPSQPELVGTEGQALTYNPETKQWEMSILPNSKLAQERADLEEKSEKADKIKETATNLVLDEIGIARELVEGQSLTSPATGITGGIVSNIDSTRAGALKNRLTTIKASIGFDKLQSMRDASPTGGALGQVSEFENRLLQAVFGSLEQSQRGADILYNLNRLEDIYNRVVHTGIPDDEARRLYREVTMADAGVTTPRIDAPDIDFTSSTAPQGLSDEDTELWPWMNEAERQAIWEAR